MKEKFQKLRDLLFSAAVLAEEIGRGLSEPKELPPSAALKIDPERLYSQGEASGILGLSSSALAKLSDKKKIDTFRPNPAGYRKYRGSVLLEFLKSKTV